MRDGTHRYSEAGAKNEYLYCETILFEKSNTCVWHVKQYCLTTQTILFRPSNKNVWSEKDLFYGSYTLIYVHSPLVCPSGCTMRACDYAQLFG